VILLEAVPSAQQWPDPLRVTRIRREPSRIIALTDTTWDALFEGCNSRFRKEFRRRERRLRERYAVRYRHADDPDRITRDIELFLKLHWTSWTAPVTLLDQQRAAFLQDFSRQALARGWLQLWFLELDRRPVAANLDFRFAGVQSAFQIAMEPAMRNQVGVAVTFHAIREAIADGADEFRFLRGSQPHKNRLPNVNRLIESQAISRGLVGDCALIALGLKHRIVSRAQSRPKKLFGLRPT
jgi:CelD/BcsL family acetyltransferase involved in cellulose biosynthesis